MDKLSITTKCNRILQTYSAASERTSRGDAIKARVKKVYDKHQALIVMLKLISLPLCFMFWPLIDGAIKGRAVNEVDDAIAFKKLQIIKKLSTDIKALCEKNGMSLEGLDFDQAKAILKRNGIDLDSSEIKQMFSEDQELILSLAQNFESYTNNIDNNKNVQSVWKRVFNRGMTTQGNHKVSIGIREKKLEETLRGLNKTELSKDIETDYKNKRVALESRAVGGKPEKKTQVSSDFALSQVTLKDSSRGSLASVAYNGQHTIEQTNYEAIDASQNSTVNKTEIEARDKKIKETNAQALSPITTLMHDIKKLGLNDKSINELEDFLNWLINQDAPCDINGATKKQLLTFYCDGAQRKVFIEFSLDKANKILDIAFNIRMNITNKEVEDGSAVPLGKMIRHKIDIKIDLNEFEKFTTQIDTHAGKAKRAEQLGDWVSNLGNCVRNLSEAKSALEKNPDSTDKLRIAIGTLETNLKTLEGKKESDKLDESTINEIKTTLSAAKVVSENTKVSVEALGAQITALKTLKTKLSKEKDELEKALESEIDNISGPKFTVQEIGLTNKGDQHKVFQEYTFDDLRVKAVYPKDLDLSDATATQKTSLATSDVELAAGNI